MKKPSFRIERINETIKEILGELLLNQIKDPRVGMVTITSVRVSSDLSTAKVHYTVMGGGDDRINTERGLQSAKNFMKKAVANELKVRNAPELRFVYDDSLDKSLAIEEALRKTGRQETQKNVPGEGTTKNNNSDGNSQPGNGS